MSDTTWIGIEDGVYFLPGEGACASRWAESMNLPPEAHEKMLQNGHRRHYPSIGLPLGELCAVAVRNLLVQSGLRPDEVGMIIHVHSLVTSIDAPPHSMVAALAKEVGMHRADAFSVSNLYCGSMIAALRIIHNLMAVDPGLENVVVVTADTIRGPELWHNDLGFAPSEGAAAIWIKRNCRRNRIGAIEVKIDADFHMGHMITPEQSVWYNMMAQMHTMRIIKLVIKRSALAVEDITKLVPHNVHLPGWREIGKRLSRSEDFVFDRNIIEKGHAYCSDLIINLVDGEFLDRRGGDAIVVAVRASVGVYAAFVLQSAC